MKTNIMHKNTPLIWNEGAPTSKNNLGVTASPQVIASMALQMVFEDMAPFNSLTFDVTPDNIKYGQETIVKVPLPSKATNFYDEETGSEWKDVKVTIDKFKKIDHSFNAVELASAQSPEGLVKLAEPMAIGLRDELIGSVQGLWTSGNFPQFIEFAEGDDYWKLLTKHDNVLHKARGPKSAAINNDLYALGLNTEVVKQSIAYHSAGSMLPSGRLPEMINTTSYRHAFPSGSDLVGFSGTQQACVLSARVPDDPTQILAGISAPCSIEYAEVMLPDGGKFRVMVNAWMDLQLGLHIRMAWMYGVAVGVRDCGCRWIKAGEPAPASFSQDQTENGPEGGLEE